MASKTSIFVDTSWFKAIADSNDDFYSQAHMQLLSLPATTQLITTNFVLDESFTLIRVKNNLSAALDFKDTLVTMRNQLKIVRVLPQDEKSAWDWFPKDWSKLSFTDCTSFAVMTRLGLERVATFDKHFARAGFQLLQ